MIQKYLFCLNIEIHTVNKAIRVILVFNKYTHVKKMLNSFDWLNVSCYIKFRVFIHQIQNQRCYS